MRLDTASLPLRDYHKAKRLLWNPQDLDFTRDRQDWEQMTPREQQLVRSGLGLFLSGEAAVTHDLSPLLLALKREGGHLEEEMFLTTQLFEEAKHVEFFATVIEACGIPEIDPVTMAGPSYQALFSELTRALDQVLTDPSRLSQVDAVVNYHMIVEGVLAETGYYGIFTALRTRGLMPGLTQGLEYVQRDEARHIAFGLHLLTRLVREDRSLWGAAEVRLNILMPLAQGVFLELLNDYLPDVPFGVDLGDMLTYAGRQYMLRVGVLERAKRGDPLDEVA
jgi:ribonucleoside-diphosphate reductase beta chain